MINDKLKVVFMGTPDFSVPTLEMLIENHNVLAVVTQPDKPKGRGYKLFPPPVKETAIKNGIDVYQPEKIKGNVSFIDILKNLSPDVIIVVAYGKILPKEIIDLPKFGCINSHASLLPRHRGASPINYSLIMGDKKTGITTMFMDEGMDTGDIIEKYEINIKEGINAGDLTQELKQLSEYAIKDTLLRLVNGEIIREKQDDSLSTYAPMLTKQIGHINFSNSAEEIVNLVRGLNPWPIAYCLYENSKLKILNAHVYNDNTQNYDKFENGMILKVDKEGILVKCFDGLVLITHVQFEGKKAMSVREFINGNIIKIVRLN